MGQPSVRRGSSATGRPGSSTSTRVINYVNIGLILASFAIALYLPFELFLFAYAILGPGHYITEISWLQKRQFFTKGSYDPWVLAVLAVVPSVFATFTFGPLKQIGSSQDMAAIIGVAFGSGLVFFLTDKTSARLVGLALVAAVSFLAVNASAFIVMVLALFVPTLVHVYIFTGLFIIFGALKERSVSGYLAFACFLFCPQLYLVIHPVQSGPSDYLVQAYWHPFSGMNTAMLGLGAPHSQAQMDENVQRVFGSETGLTVMRFIAFAYTYHYLNWFSKTGIIKWHKISVRRLSLIGGLWAGCIALYFYNYSVAMKVLFCLSFLHVFLEFPLNHMSIMGVVRELSATGLRFPRAARRVSPPVPATTGTAARSS
jgi:hypothetical protein